MATFVKDPDSVLDYRVDWSAWLDGDTIIASTFTPADDTLTVDLDLFTTTTATVWLSGGTLGKTTVTNHITTAAGRQNDYTLKFTIKET